MTTSDKNNPKFLRLAQIAAQKGGMLLSTVYERNNKKMLWRCSSGHEWHTTPVCILQGCWCPHCSGKAKLSHEDVATEAHANGIMLVSEFFKGINHLLSWSCVNKGHIFSSSLKNLRNSKTWCAVCRDGLTGSGVMLERVKAKAAERGGKCLATSYSGNKSKLLFECSRGHLFKMSTNHVTSGMHWCPECYHDDRNISVAAVNKRVNDREGELLSPVSCIRSETVLHVKCKYDHAWKTTAGSLMSPARPSWCPECGINSKGKRLNIKRLQDICASRSGFLLSTTIKNQKSLIDCKCANGHIWQTTPFCLVYRESWCPECAGNAGETYSLEHVKKMTGLSFRKVRPSWLMGLNGKPLELDAFCEEQMFAIEYQGQQHYEFIPGWHKTQEYFKESQERDALKRRLCAERGVLLFEIPYVLRPTPDRIAAHVESEAQKACLPFAINPEFRAMLDELGISPSQSDAGHEAQAAPKAVTGTKRAARSRPRKKPAADGSCQ